MCMSMHVLAINEPLSLSANILPMRASGYRNRSCTGTPAFRLLLRFSSFSFSTAMPHCTVKFEIRLAATDEWKRLEALKEQNSALIHMSHLVAVEVNC